MLKKELELHRKIIIDDNLINDIRNKINSKEFSKAYRKTLLPQLFSKNDPAKVNEIKKTWEGILDVIDKVK